MNEILSIPILPVLVTLSTFYIGIMLRRTIKTPLCNPVLVAVLMILVFLSVTGMDLKAYQACNTYLSWLLAPATVSLAVPLYEHFKILRKHISVLLTSVAAGAISCLMMVMLFCSILHFSPEITISLLPKSVTTAIGVPLSEMAGGITSVTTAAILTTGVVASVLGPTLCQFFHLTDDIAKGAAYGTAGHVIGTTKAMEQSALAGAASSLSLGVAGLLTAIIFPIVVSFL